MSKVLSWAHVSVVGEALYGPRWKSALSRDLDVPLRTFMRWIADGDALKVEHLVHLRRALRCRLEGIEDARRLLWSNLEVVDG